MKTNIFRKILGTFAVAFLALGVGVAFRIASAGTGHSASGWLWGGSETVSDAVMNGNESGTGWISMNDVNAGSGGGTYGVNIPSSDGPVTGYAWWGHGLPGGSGDWLEFQPAGPYPESPSSGVQRQGNSLVGWGRFVGIRNNVAVGNAGGFDGWVKFSGIATNGSPYSVTISGTTLSGYAWSSDLGWIDFTGVSVTPPNALQICRDGIPINGSGVDFSLAVNQTTNLKAYLDNVPGDCVGNDVTSSPTTTWTESGPNAVSLSGTNPKTVTAGAVASPAEHVAISHNDSGTIYSVAMNISVTCSETVNCSDERAAVCKGEFIPAGTIKAGACGPVDCGNLEGTRYCDFNWKEVAPGN